MTKQTGNAVLNGQSLKEDYSEGVDWDSHIAKITLNDLFNDAVQKYADQPCIDFFGTKLSFKELEDLTNKAAKGFQDMGVTKGTKVGLYMPNTHWHPVLFFGALKAGAIVVNYSTVYVENELKQQIEDSDTTILVTSDKPDNYKNATSLLKGSKLEKVLTFHLADATAKGGSLLPAKMRFGLPLVKILNKFKNFFNFSSRGDITHMDGFINNDGQYEEVKVDPDDTAVLQYTSGSSGVPKGCELTHYNVSSNAQQVALYISDNPNMPDSPYSIKSGESKMFAPLPFFHIFGMTATMVSPLHMGIETVVVMDPRDMETSEKVIAKTQPDFAAFVPKLVSGMDRAGQLEDTCLKAIVTGGSAMPTALHEEIHQKYDLRIFPGYGLSETAPVLTVNPIIGAQSIGSAGKPIPGVEIRVCDINDPNKVLNIGEDGELQAAGPNIMKGYLNRPDDTDEVMVTDDSGKRWFRTGDIGNVTADGHVFITDRLKRMINVKGTGKKSWPSQIENEIAKHPDVAECVVIAVHKGTNKEEAKAFVQCKEGKSLSSEDIQEHLESHLSRLEIPRLYEFIDEIPMNASSKPDWKKLEDMEAEKTQQLELSTAWSNTKLIKYKN